MTRAPVWRRYGILAVVGGAVVIISIGVAVSAFDVAARSDGSPVVPPGNWHLALQASIVISFVAYALALLAVSIGHVPLRWAIAIAGVIQAFPLLGPILLSTDVRTYAEYGRMAALDGSSPYVESATNQLPSVYGPLFSLESELVAVVSRGSEGTAVLIHRLLAVACVLAVGLLAARLAANGALALAIVAWNPLVAFHFGGGGHNDALMVALALLAMLLARRQRWGQAGAVWCASSFVKLLTIALVPIEALAVWRRSGRAALARFALGWATAGVVFAVVASLRYGSSWFDAVQTLRDIGSRTGSIGLSHWLIDAGVSEGNRHHVIAVLQLGTVGALSFGAARTGHARLGLAATLLAFFQGWLNPWYAIWGLGLSAADDRDRIGRVLSIALCGYLLTDITTW